MQYAHYRGLYFSFQILLSDTSASSVRNASTDPLSNSVGKGISRSHRQSYARAYMRDHSRDIHDCRRLAVERGLSIVLKCVHSLLSQTSIDRAAGLAQDAKGTYQELPTGLLPFCSASRRYCAARNCARQPVSLIASAAPTSPDRQPDRRLPWKRVRKA